MRKTAIKDFFENKKALIRIGIVALLLLFTYVADMVPFMFWRGISPDLLIVFAISAAMFENPLAAAIIGTFAGLLKDISSSGIFGFHGLIYLALCLAVSLLVTFLVRRNFTNALIINAAAITADKFFYFFIYNVLFEKGGRIALFYRSVIPSVLLSIIAVPITYFIIKKINDYFNPEI